MAGEITEQHAGGSPERLGSAKVDRKAGDSGQANRTIWQRAARHLHNAALRHQVGNIVKHGISSYRRGMLVGVYRRRSVATGSNLTGRDCQLKDQ
jgi:hypothetical protein